MDAGTFGLILPMPAPLFWAVKKSVVPPLNVPAWICLIVSNTATSTFLTALVRMNGPR
jgi:hypothetical protein